MQYSVMHAVSCLMTEKISVSTSLLHPPVAFLAPLTDADCYRSIGEGSADIADEACHAFIREIRILATLKDECAETKIICEAAGREDSVMAQPVTLR